VIYAEIKNGIGINLRSLKRIKKMISSQWVVDLGILFVDQSLEIGA